MKLNHQLVCLFAIFTILLFVWNPASAEQTVIQTQYGPDGMEVDLVRAKVSGKVLSVVFSFRHSGEGSAEVKYDIANVHYIDNMESKKYHVLKDSQGEFLAGPIDFVKRRVDGEWERIPVSSVYISYSQKKVMWYKFPLPPDNVTHIQINLPDISPFDDIEITR